MSLPDQDAAARRGVSGVFFYVAVTSALWLRSVSGLSRASLTVDVGEVLPLAEARVAHEMLAGRPHRRGKIVLKIDAPERP